MCRNKGNTATLSAKYQISIPKAVRSALAWKPGQEFVFIPKSPSGKSESMLNGLRHSA
jgi:AbrB family looped-hinge helix DNA binding protein